MHLDGDVTLEAAIRLIKRDTRHYARRQMTWFRGDDRVIWVKTPTEAARRVRSFLGARRKR
jgi:tRNA dimethylallyltransferase